MSSENHLFFCEHFAFNCSFDENWFEIKLPNQIKAKLPHNSGDSSYSLTYLLWYKLL